MVKVEIEKKVKDVNVSDGSRILDLMNVLGVSPEEFVSILNGEVVTEHEPVSNGDSVRFVRVWSGG